MNQPERREMQSEIRVVVEVDGNPVGFLNLNIDRLWPLISHHKREIPIEWVDKERFDTVMRAAVIQHLMNRLQTHLYQALGNEIVRAELDIETFTLKAEGVAQAFGRTRKDIENLLSESGKTAADFQAFFWEYMLDDREGVDPKKEWKARKG
jgi:hypothetical protein